MARALSVWFALGLIAATSYGQLSSSDLDELRKQGQAEGWTFTVGENWATRQSSDDLFMEVDPPGSLSHYRHDPCPPRGGLRSAFDWCDESGCPPIRIQGTCGSCWAFAALGAMECAVLINDGTTVDLSEQWLISCTDSGDCTGGWHYNAFSYLMENGLTDPCGDWGAVFEADFPYVALDTIPCECPYVHPYWLNDWAFVGSPSGIPTVEQLKQAILDHGPVAVALYANGAFVGYTGGVFNACEDEWINHEVVLVGWDDSLGTSGAWRIRNHWDTSWGEQGYGWIEYECSRIGYAAAYVEYTGSQQTLTFFYPDGLPEMASPDAPTTFRVQVAAGTGTPIPNTGQLHYRLDDGNWQMQPMTMLTMNEYEAVLPLASCFSIYDWYVGAAVAQGGYYFDPADAPESAYEVMVATGFEATFTDDFETDTGWTAGAPDDDATAGLWERVDPVGTYVSTTPVQPEDDHSADPGTMCFVTGQSYGGSAGASDVDGGKTTLISPLLDLFEANDAIISYWRWYTNDEGAAPAVDVFTVDITDDDGSNWVNVETVGPDGPEASGEWFYHEFRLSEFVNPTSLVRVRFVASDEDAASLVDAAVDDFTVSALVCAEAQPEACCYADGACADLRAYECTAAGGTPWGADTECATTECPVAPQACCFDDLSCDDLAPDDCTAAGGTPWGVDTDCATTTCPDPREIEVTLIPSVNPAGVCPDTTFTVDIALAALDGDLPSVRTLRFDVAASSGLTVDDVVWDLPVSMDGLYVQEVTLPLFTATYLGTGPIEGMIVDLTSVPQVVAHLTVTYPGGDAVLDVVGPVEGGPDEGAYFMAGFEPVLEFRRGGGNVLGGAMSFSEAACTDLHIVDSTPGDGAIDARQPLDPDTLAVCGWTSVEITFDDNAESLIPANFELTEVCEAGACDGIPPTVMAVEAVGAVATVTFDRPIDPKAWTVVAVVGGDPADVVRLGYLPGDADGSLLSNANDVVVVVEHVRAADGGNPPPFHQADIDRSDSIRAVDITVLVDLLNGAAPFESYSMVGLPPMP